jgi:HSP20 family protein
MSVSNWIYDPFYSNDSLFNELLSRPFHLDGPSISSSVEAHPLKPRYVLQDVMTLINTNQSICRLDLYESPKTNSCIATFELAGFKKEDIKIEVNNNFLTVSGESNSSVDKAVERRYAIRERKFGKVLRSVQLPQGINVGFPFALMFKLSSDSMLQSEEIKASMENGVLTVTFPKSAPESAPKSVIIQ